MKVTCICPTTASRREWLPKAIACFQAQTYEDRHLLIIADAEEDVSGLVPDDERISITIAGRRLAIGAKRNLGCDLATGEVICHFDDDDFSYPDRIADQVARLELSGKAVTGYHSIKFTDGERWWQYKGTPEWAFDASLCYLRSFWETHPFAEINDGLEAPFRAAAAREQQFISVNGSDLMYATIHPDNTGLRVITPGSASWEEIASA